MLAAAERNDGCPRRMRSMSDDAPRAAAGWSKSGRLVRHGRRTRGRGIGSDLKHAIDHLSFAAFTPPRHEGTGDHRIAEIESCALCSASRDDRLFALPSTLQTVAGDH
jgi:hypothetical protein